jgi:predicted glutamine amidotransferase
MCKHIMILDFNITNDLKLITDFADRTNENDGYGAMLRVNDGSIDTIKSLSLAAFYMTLHARLIKGDITAVVVHHRTSTNGDGLDYAHPFEYNVIYMTHNGVIQVPDKHETRTTNDSEQLLHHLIKSEFNTKSVSGYYSCFIMTPLENGVLVDETAPIYSDGRVYCSHKLLDSYQKIEKRLISYDNATGHKVLDQEIEVSKSSYGRDKAHLSLGKTYSVTDDRDWKSWTYNDYLDETPKSNTNLIDFFDLITDEEKIEFSKLRDESDALEYIERTGTLMGLTLSLAECEEIYLYLMEMTDDNALYA